MLHLLRHALLLFITAQTLIATDWTFVDVTETVVDHNPPGIGPVFDYAFLDLNDDKLLDIVLNNHHQSKPSPIWLGTPDHTFRLWGNMPEAWIPIAGFHLGEVDHNNDGKTDLICTGNEGGVVININTSTADALSFNPVPVHHSSHLVSFIDFDGDGQLETLVRPGQVFGSLTAAPVMTGIQYGNWTVADFDNDGWPDLFAAGVQSRRAHWTGPRKLYRNLNGQLKALADPPALLADHFDGIPKAADFNNDGNFDLYIFGGSHPDGTATAMKLFLGDGAFGFEDVSERAGISASRQKSGYSHVYLADLDNDTHLDLVNQGNYGTTFWRNQGDGSFAVLPRETTDTWHSNAHMRFDDYDMDGRLDFVTGGVGPGWKDRSQSIRVFRNTTETGNHWLKLQLRQEGGNTQCIGAIASVYKAGTRERLGTRMLYADTEGYHPRLHFGLGRCEQVDVEIIFPTNKKRVRFPGISANRYLVLRPTGEATDVVYGKTD